MHMPIVAPRTPASRVQRKNITPARRPALEEADARHIDYRRCLLHGIAQL